MFFFGEQGGFLDYKPQCVAAHPLRCALPHFGLQHDIHSEGLVIVQTLSAEIDCRRSV